MIRRIVYLIEQPLDARNYERFGIQSWIDQGWHVEVWDLTPLSHPRVWRESLQQGGSRKEFAHYFPITSRRDLRRRCEAPDTVGYFIDFAGESYYSARAQARLADRGAAKLDCSTGTIPAPGNVRKANLAARIRKARAAGAIRSLRVVVDGVRRRWIQPTVPASVKIVSGESSMPATP